MTTTAPSPAADLLRTLRLGLQVPAMRSLAKKAGIPEDRLMGFRGGMVLRICDLQRVAQGIHALRLELRHPTKPIHTTGDLLTDLRLALRDDGISCADLGTAAGISRMSAWRFLSGRCCTIDHAVCFAQAIGAEIVLVPTEPRANPYIADTPTVAEGMVLKHLHGCSKPRWAILHYLPCSEDRLDRALNTLVKKGLVSGPSDTHEYALTPDGIAVLMRHTEEAPY